MIKNLLIGAVFVAAFAAASAAAPPDHAPKIGFARDAGAAKTVTARKGDAPPPCTTAADTNVVIGSFTICGLLGTNTTAVYSYQGIPYASSPGRFQSSFESPVTTSIDATQFGPVCPQYPAPTGATMDDDCLYINIWTPAGSAAHQGTLPVMVYIHGGAFLSGSGSSALFDGTALASQGVIVVTMNYRLGALGFLSTAANTDGVSATGNYGLMDQHNAIEWVKHNITQFGGNPNNVTLFGESAGAMSVGLHIFSMPAESGLFQAAIMQSNPLAIQYQTAQDAQAYGNAFMAYLCAQAAPTGGCNNSTWYSPSNIDAAAFAEAQLFFFASNPPTGGGAISLPFQPVLDANVTTQPSDGFQTDSAKIPVVFGLNQNEGPLFIGLYNSLNNPPSTATSGPTRKQYFKIVSSYFDKPMIERIKGNPNYRPWNGKGDYYSHYGTQLARILTNYVFICSNASTANKVLGQVGSIPVYAYMFSQPPFFDSYVTAKDQARNSFPDSHACWPDFHNTCHGNELPYVFNTLSYETNLNPPVYNPKASDQPLATAMNTAWANFAKKPSSPGSSDWQRYANTSIRKIGTAKIWKGNENRTVNLDDRANCTSFWWK